MKRISTVKKNHVLKESFIASVILLFAAYIISFIPWSLEYGKALHQGFADFDIYDLYYSGKNNENTKRDSNIVLVQLDTGRNEIAQEIQLLDTYNPRVIAIDAFFEQPSENDSLFYKSVQTKSNIIFLNRNTDEGLQPNIFYNQPDKCGFANFIGDKYSVVRSFYPRLSHNGVQYDAFAACIARQVSKESYDKLGKRNNKMEIIDYKGNLETFTNFTTDELLQYQLTGQLERIIKDKIVLLGFFEKDSSNIILDDLHYTPLNEVVTGKSYPDMYGVVIHANILSMILGGKYPFPPNTFISYLFAFIITFLFNFYILSGYRIKKHPSHTVFLIVQVFVILFVLYFFLKLYDWFLFKVSLEPIMITLVLSLEFFGIYQSLALWLNKRYNYTTVLKQK